MRKIIARLLVFCMLLSMMAVPAMATASHPLTDSSWTAGSYHLTYDTTTLTPAYNISSGAYTIDLVGETLDGKITISNGAKLRVVDNAYQANNSTGNLSAKITLSGLNSRFTYSVAEDTYVIRGSAFKVLPNNANYEVVWESEDNYSIAHLNYIGGGSGSGSSSGSSTTKNAAAGSLTGSLNDDAVASARESGEPVALSITAEAASNSASAAEITVNVPKSVSSDNPVDVELPVSNLKSTSVVILVNADGTEEIIMDAALTDKGLVFTVSGDTKVKVIDNAKNFSDSAAVSDWAKESVGFVTSREIFNGTDKGFEPSVPLTRGMFAQVLHNFMGKPAVSGEAFADASGKWYDSAATWGNSVGVVLGDDKGKFNGDAVITRQDLVTMLYRFADSKKFDTTLPTENVLGKFNDVESISDYAQQAVEWAVANDVLIGMNKKLNPTLSASREMVAAFVARFCNNVIH